MHIIKVAFYDLLIILTLRHWLHYLHRVLSMIVYVGPKDRTLVDFWRLVWQERPLTIVMVTNIKEGNKVKCQQYWPDSGSKHFGHFKVTLVEYQVLADYVIRTLQVIVSEAYYFK